MRIKIHQILLPLDYEEKDILKAAAAKLGCNESLISGLRLIRRSIDARSRREAPLFSLTIELDFINSESLSLSNIRDVEILDGQEVFTTSPAIRSAGKRPVPVVVGAGPSGLMAALALAEAGLSPLLIERGSPANKRASEVSLFWKKGVLNPEGNVLFGEGGAGLFSDGKLTTRSKDRLRVRRFLETLVKCGAPEDILIDAEPHLGSDILKKIVPAFRNLIEKNGGEVQFNSRFEGIHTDKNRVRGIVVNGKE
ncbi:MAG: FAD-binding protein, partial [Proteobacteria bacterium]|nr:FAD-binding protein [Pseudomonadota bacterium]